MAVRPYRVLLLATIFTALLGFGHAAIVMKVAGTDSLKIYSDGVEEDSHNSKTTAKTVNLPDSTQVVGIYGSVDKSSTTFAGILASFQMEYEGDYVTDGTWKCSESYTSGWAGANFDDSLWQSANTTGDNDNSQPPGLSVVSGIISHAKWIWTAKRDTSVGDQQVYCRGRIGIDRSYDNYGRKFAIGFVDNHVVTSNKKGIKLLLTTLIPTGVTVYCFTPHISSGNNHLSEVRTVAAGEVQTIKPYYELRNTGTVVNGDRSILCVATAPVKIVGENQEQHSSDLFLNLPIDAIGVESDSVEYYTVHWDDSDDGYDLRVLLVAAYDNTQIQITPKSSVTYDGTKGAGTTFTITLNKYRTCQLAETGKDLTGTRIVSNKPLAVYSGNKKTRVRGTDATSSSADHLIEQLTPVKTWGDKFAITPLPHKNIANGQSYYRYQAHLTYYKVLSAKAGTTVTIKSYDGTTLQDTITQTLNAGDEYLYTHKVSRVAYVTSSSGIQLAQFATTKLNAECTGDPWMQIIPPIYAFDRDYTILPPTLSEKSGCTNSNFFTVIVKTAVKDNVKVVQGTTSKLIGELPTSGNTLPRRLNYYVIPDTDYSYQTVEIPSGEIRVQHSDNTVNVGLFFFGYGSLDSYAAMGGTRMAPINEPCVTSSSTPGDGLDNNCNGQIDEEDCATADPNRDCALPSPVNGAWSAWEAAGACICNDINNVGGPGTQSRTRSCSNPVPQNNGLPCSGEAIEEITCTCQKIDGEWTDWSGYGQCSASCGDGVKTRTKTCTKVYPANGGADCPGASSETAVCNDKPCPINGGFSAWQDSGSCVCSSGYSGSQLQTRSCTSPTPQYGGTNCTGSYSKNVNCNCPRDGVFTVWTSWGTCSKTCGLGVHSRSRTCTNPTPAWGGANCTGDYSQTAQCNVTGCPVNGGWSAWDNGTSCSCVSGLTGEIVYSRTCDNPAPLFNGAPCDTSVNGATRSEACDCTSSLPQYNDYTISENKTVSCSCTTTVLNATIADCVVACNNDNNCDALSYNVTATVNKCTLYDAAGSISTGTGTVVLQNTQAVAQEASQSALEAQAQNQNEDQGNSEAQQSDPAPIAAGAAGIGVAAIAAAGLIIFIRRRKQKKEEEEKRKRAQSAEADDGMTVDDLDFN